MSEALLFTGTKTGQPDFGWGVQKDHEIEACDQGIALPDDRTGKHPIVGPTGCRLQHPSSLGQRALGFIGRNSCKPVHIVGVHVLGSQALGKRTSKRR